MAVGTNGTATAWIQGVVASVNDKGLRLEGRDGWLNYSKWAGAIVPPARGEAVAVTLDGAGFVRRVEPLDGSRDAPVSPVAAPQGAPAAGPAKDTTITRLAILKAATAFCASRPDLKSADLFALAERMEAWVNRD